MITVSLTPKKQPRSQNFIPDEPPYLVTGIVNWRLTVRPHSWRPPTDIYETEDRFVVRVEVAGMEDADFAISVDNNTLGIRGGRSDTHERRAFHQMEIRFGEFNIEVEFPSQIEMEKVEAHYHDGFLKVVLPKVTPKKLNIGD